MPAPGETHSESIGSEAELEEMLTRPREVLGELLRTLPGPLMILGAGGKMGPTLAVLARRAAERVGRQIGIVAVSRFGDASAREWLEARGVTTIAADLHNPEALSRLPDAPSVAYLVGLKFGTGRDPAATWAANTLIPAAVCERFAGSRIVALSTGNVYPFVSPSSAGALETDPLTPLGEYANAAVARERIFEWCARRRRTPVALLRLSYAVELRYGVLVDLARKVQAGEPISLENGHFNCIWQRDANEAVLRAFGLASVPASAWNLCRPEAFEVRQVATRLGVLLGRTPRFAGIETGTALLSNTSKLEAVLGTPEVGLDSMVRWVSAWVRRGGQVWDKPTHFETRDGRY